MVIYYNYIGLSPYRLIILKCGFFFLIFSVSYYQEIEEKLMEPRNIYIVSNVARQSRDVSFQY